MSLYEKDRMNFLNSFYLFVFLVILKMFFNFQNQIIENTIEIII